MLVRPLGDIGRRLHHALHQRLFRSELQSLFVALARRSERAHCQNELNHRPPVFKRSRITRLWHFERDAATSRLDQRYNSNTPAADRHRLICRALRLAKRAKSRKVAATSLIPGSGEGIEDKEARLKGVHVTTAARLHLGFLDLAGDLGRRFGSIGLAIDAFETRIELRGGRSFEVSGAERERGEKIARRVAESLGIDMGGKLIISNAIPAHAGLGSGTQLALAIAAAFRRLAQLPLDAREDARLLDRGARSGVGVALFERGGLAVDAGRGPNTETPPVVAWMNFPSDWRVLLLLDPRVEGAHGDAEKRAFGELPRFPAEAANEICRRTLMQILPGAAETDLEAFGEGVTRIQEILGDHFAPVQGGGRFMSVPVGRAAERLKALGARGIGQSSWGPTGFAFASDPDHAQYLAGLARAEQGAEVEIRICSARRHGAEIHEDEDISVR
jgi:beta-ribofuranosylaminobenzene 5'-phosphate synthase